MEILDFDFDFVKQARKFNNRQAIGVLSKMTDQKRK
jgi:hypothetical protein